MNAIIHNEILKNFRILCIKRQERIGEAVGRLISEEVKRNSKLIGGEVSK